MLKLRLQRVGRKHDPSYRIVVTEHARGPKSRDYVEMLGSYDARKKAGKDNPQLDKERVSYWLGQGVKPSGTVHNLLVDAGLIEGKKINVLPKKNPIIKEEEAPAEEPKEEVKEENTTSDDSAEKTEETPAEEPKEEPKEEVKEEEAPTTEEEKKEEASE